MKTMIRVTIAVLWVVSVSTGDAQQPAPAIPPIRGQVRSVDGVPIADAEVTADGARESVRSDSRGLFLIHNLSKGTHTLSVRRLGYLPAVATFNVPQRGDSLAVVMVPSRTQLDTVKVTARASVLAGVVVDERNRPLPGASVELNAGPLGTVVTGADGWFSFVVPRNGPTVIRVLRQGYVGLMQSVRLEDSRGIVVHMTRIDTALSKGKQQSMSGLGPAARHVWVETQQRLVRRSLRSIILTRDELAEFDDVPLGQAIMQARSATNLMQDLVTTSNTACVLLNGYQAIGDVSLDTYNTDDVEFVELYPPEAAPPRTVVAYMQNAGCRTVTTDVISRGVFYAVVWLRN